MISKMNKKDWEKVKEYCEEHNLDPDDFAD